VDQIQIVQDCNLSASNVLEMADKILTGNAGEELSCKALNLTVWERNKGVALEKIKDTLTE
jgi:hypothetical protein